MGVKKIVNGKVNFGFVIKGILPLEQEANISYNYLFSSGNLNDGKAAISLLKDIDECLLLPNLKYQTINPSYDYEAIY